MVKMEDKYKYEVRKWRSREILKLENWKVGNKKVDVGNCKNEKWNVRKCRKRWIECKIKMDVGGSRKW